LTQQSSSQQHRQQSSSNSKIKTPIDVAIITMNSERKLSECLDSVYRNIPVNNLIVVDGFSTDNTIAIIQEYKEKYGKSYLCARERNER
jgi:glycosyltransferase involved in cell wall biosynthesis